MGYYLDLRFDTKTVPDWRAAVERLGAAGAKIRPWEEIDPDFHWVSREYQARNVELEAPMLPFITVNKDAKEGEWVDMRLSWGTGDAFVSILEDILDFADRAGCRVYDGQQDVYATRETLEELAGKFFDTSRKIVGMLGQVGGTGSSEGDSASEYGPGAPSPEWKGYTQEQLLALPISADYFTARAVHSLRVVGVNTVGELVQHSEKEVAQMPHLGRIGMRGIKMVVSEMGLALRADTA